MEKRSFLMQTFVPLEGALSLERLVADGAVERHPFFVVFALMIRQFRFRESEVIASIAFVISLARVTPNVVLVFPFALRRILTEIAFELLSDGGDDFFLLMFHGVPFQFETGLPHKVAF